MQNPFGNLLLQIQERIKSLASAIREVNEDTLNYIYNLLNFPATSRSRPKLFVRFAQRF